MGRDRPSRSSATTFVLVLLAAVAVTAAAARDTRTSSFPVAPAGAPLPRAASCPLTPLQQVKSVRVFAEMMPVFRHPRCTNCHGGVNPFVEQEVGHHRGGAMAAPPPNNIEQCQECHDQLVGWDIPGTPLFFAGKSDQDICEQVKAFAETGQSFIEHIRNDHGGIQFIAAGFAGARALDAQSRADHDVTVEPPPGTQAELTETARKWVRAMGGEFVGPLDCGCTVPALEVRFQSTLTTVYGEGAGGSATVTGKGTIILKLTANGSEPEYDVTSGPAKTTGLISWSAVSITPGKATGCEAFVLASTPTKFDVWLSVGAAEAPTLELKIVPETDLHSVRQRCRTPTGAWATAPVSKVAGTFSNAWLVLHGQGEGTAALGQPKMPSTATLEQVKKMAEQMQAAQKASPSATPDLAKMQEMVKMMVPDADARLKAAQKNFTLSMPGECVQGTNNLAQCTISQKRTVSGAEITENTLIAIGVAPAGAR